MNPKIRHLCLAALFAVAALYDAAEANDDEAAKPEPVRICVIGLVHGHADDILAYRGDAVEIVGVSEPNRKLAQRLFQLYDVDQSLWFADAETMLDKTAPAAAVVFSNTFEHKEAVEACAQRGVHVMMEKPLAVSLEHARAINEVAKKHRVHVLVNYETTWYRSNRAAYSLAHEEKKLGELRKIVFHTGHPGPIEIGCSDEFVEWLTDPTLNGGGALTDFGCYGANLATWLMNNQRPLKVTAVTQTMKPETYPRVDDEATIVLTYPSTQAIIQASWNWPYHRKDMAVYGTKGVAKTIKNHGMRFSDYSLSAREEQAQTTVLEPPDLPEGQRDPLEYLAAVVRGDVTPGGLSSLENNLIVAEILDAARQSAATGKAVVLRKVNADKSPSRPE